MKTKTLFMLTIALIITILPVGYSTKTFASFDGALDIVNSSTISGWAWNPDRPKQICDVHIYISDASSSKILSVIPVRADKYRNDLVKSGFGTGNYAFSYNINWDSLPSAEFYSVKAYKVDGSSNPQLGQTINYSPKHSINASFGTFTATAYCACRRCTPGLGRTATGTRPKANHTISVDPRIIPLGSKILINDIVYTAEDTGSGVKRNHIDIYFNTHHEALRFGRQTVTAFIFNN